MQYSPFTSVLKVLLETSGKVPLRRIYDLLSAVLVENSILQDSSSSFASLISSMEPFKSESLKHMLGFLDNCICRGAKRPVQYIDMAASLSENASSVSPLVAAMIEQWPFLLRGGDTSSAADVAAWIAGFLGRLKQAGEDARSLHRACKIMLEASESKQIRSSLKEAFKSKDVEPVHGGTDTGDDQKNDPEQKETCGEHVDLIGIFGPLPTESETRHELHRWEKEEVVVAVEEGHIAKLMLCLNSEYEEVRRQAFMNLCRFMQKVKVS